MKWRKLAFWSGLSLTVLLAALALAVWTVDLGFFKPRIERLVSEATGREFAIDGPLSIDIGNQSVLVADNIRFADADRDSDGDMLTIGHVEIRVATWSFLKGRGRVDFINIEKAQLRLRVDEDGSANWAFAPDSKPPAGVANAANDAPSLLIRQAIIDDADIVYSSPARVGPLEIRIARLEQTLQPDEFLRLDLQGNVGGRELSALGKVGTWSALQERKNVAFELDATVDSLKVAASGQIDDLVKPRRPAISFSAQAPDINDLLRALQLPPGGSGTIDLRGSLAGEDDGPLVLDVGGNLGQMAVDATGSFSDLSSLDEVDLALATSGPDLARVLGLFGIHEIGNAPFDVALQLQRRGSLLTVDKGFMRFADGEFNFAGRMPGFPSMDDARLNMSIAGPDLEKLRSALNLPWRAAGAYSLDFDLDVTPEGVEVARLEVESRLLRITGRTTLGTAPQYFGSEFDLRVSTESVAELGRAFGVGDLPDRAMTIEGAAAYLADGLRTRGPVAIRSGDVIASIDGLITLREDVVGSDLAFTVRGPDIAMLIREFAAVDEVPAQPYDIAGRVAVEPANFRVQELAGKIGSASVNLDGMINRGKSLAGTRLDFRMAGPALEELTARVSSLKIRPGRFDLSGVLAMSDASIRLDGIRFARELGEANMDFVLALPLSQRNVSFDIRARGQDIGAIVGQPLGFKANASPFEVTARGTLLGSGVSIDSLDAKVGNATASANGTLDLASSRQSTTFRIDLDVPDLAELGLLEDRRLRKQGLSLTATANGDADALVVDDLHARIGDSDIHGTVRIEKGDVPRLTIDVTSDELLFAPFTEDAEFEYDPEPTFDDGRLLPNTALPIEQLRALNGDLKISIGSLRRGPLHLTDVSLVTTLQDGTLNITKLGFNGRSGWFRARGSLQPLAKSAKIVMEMATRDFALGLPGVNEDLSGRANIDLNVSATGTRLRELAGNAEGILYVDIRGGHVEELRALRRLYGDMLNEIVETINPFAEVDKTVDVECVVAPLRVVGGELTTQPEILAITDKIQILAKAKIDLSTEELRVHFRTTPNKGISLSAAEILNPYVGVVGTLSAPRLAVDKQGTLISGGAAAVTGGLSVLGKAAWDRLSRSRDRCAKAATQARAELGSRFPQFTDKAGQ